MSLCARAIDHPETDNLEHKDWSMHGWWEVTESKWDIKLLIQIHCAFNLSGLVDSAYGLSFLLRQSCRLEVQRETSGILKLLGGKRETAKQSRGTEKTGSEAPGGTLWCHFCNSRSLEPVIPSMPCTCNCAPIRWLLTFPFLRSGITYLMCFPLIHMYLNYNFSSQRVNIQR